MFTSIDGRAVVVTGATRGIGKGIAAVFARSGARVLITGRDAQAAKACVDELSAGGAEVSSVLSDVGRREDCERMAQVAAGGWAASTSCAPTPGSSPTRGWPT